MKRPQPWVRMSPFFPHGGIPVPLSGDVVAQPVEGTWQALKVFQDCDVADTGSPLSHAALIRLHVEERWPAEELASVKTC